MERDVSETRCYCKRILCKLKLKTVFKVTIITLLLSILIPEVRASNKRDKATHVYEGKVSKDDTQRISILIGDGDDVKEKAGGEFGLFEEDSGGGGSGNSTGGGTVSVSTTWDKCNAGSSSRCCYQYTWPGYLPNIPDPTNATCEYLRKEKRDDTFACFDPLVFTEPTANPRSTPPDFAELRQRSQDNNWNIYCPMADKNCITYTYYSRDENKRIANQTKFCGVVLDSNTGNRIRDGCYRQNMPGYIREVCVYTRSLGNSSGASSILRLSLSRFRLWSTLFLAIVFSLNVSNSVFQYIPSVF